MPIPRPALAQALRARAEEPTMNLEAEQMPQDAEFREDCKCPKCGYVGPSAEFQVDVGDADIGGFGG